MTNEKQHKVIGGYYSDAKISLVEKILLEFSDEEAQELLDNLNSNNEKEGI